MCTMFLITPAIKENALRNASSKIIRYRHRAAIMRRIAGFLGEKHVTMSIEPQLQALFPGADLRVLEDAGLVDVYIADGSDYFVINNRYGQQIDAEVLFARAKAHDETANSLEIIIANIDTLIDEYNAIADAYAQLYGDLYQFAVCAKQYTGLPEPDIDLEYNYIGQHFIPKQQKPTRTD